MIHIAIIAAAMIHICPALGQGDAMQGRPISWDQLGIYPLDNQRKLDPEDLAEIDLLRKGEGSEVRARALARLRTKPDNLVAGWIFGQAARIGKNPDDGLRLLAPLASKGGVGVEYARLKCERIKLVSIADRKSADDILSQVRADAKRTWDRHPDAEELLPLYVDVLEPDDADSILIDFASRHKPDRIVKLELIRIYESKPRLVRPILDDLLKENPNDPAANFYAAAVDAASDKPKQAIGLFQWLLKNAALPEPMADLARAYLATPKPNSLQPVSVAE